MKKIGIMSMQRIINYGSFLQAYGLKKTIENLGNYDVQFVDYQYESAINSNKGKLINRIKKRLSVKYVEGKIYTKKCTNRLRIDMKNIGIDKPNYHANVDTLVIGSDEVFNCLQGYPVGFSRELFGKNYENKRVVSYAASFGYTTLALLKKYNLADQVSIMLSKFYDISVRDNNSYDIVFNLTGRRAQVNLDPVLVYDFAEELQIDQKDKENYIIVYAYTNRLSSKEERYIKKFAEKNCKKIYSIGNYLKIADKNIICNPLEVFHYFKNADYVITDTFHGTIFSIKTNVKFCTIIRNSNKNKLNALLYQMGREDRIVDALEDIEKLYNVDINYENTNNIIKKEKEKAIKYLKENL
jgi:polysaccharide pyruvyl transferase WcaK-like protein